MEVQPVRKENTTAKDSEVLQGDRAHAMMLVLHSACRESECQNTSQVIIAGWWEIFNIIRVLCVSQLWVSLARALVIV